MLFRIYNSHCFRDSSTIAKLTGSIYSEVHSCHVTSYHFTKNVIHHTCFTENFLKFEAVTFPTTGFAIDFSHGNLLG